MAENESLDFKSPQARRWNAVWDAVRKGNSGQEVGTITRKTFLKAIHKVVSQFEGYQVTTDDFLTNRSSTRDLKNLVRQTKRHSYAELLVTILDSYPAAPATECLYRWGHAILEKVFNQIGLNLVGSEAFPTAFDFWSYFREVRDEVEDTLEMVAARLAADPNWKPIVRGKQGEAKADATTELLPMSLVRGPR